MNRLPSSVLKNKSPYEVLYNKTPDYTELKVFGCLAFSANPKVTTDKLEPRGIPCVFLGYHPSQKGVRLLNMLTKTVFVSRDVKYREDIYPFNKTSQTSVYLDPLPVAMPTQGSTSNYNMFDLEYDPEDFGSQANIENNTENVSSRSNDTTDEEVNSESNTETETLVRRSVRIRQPPAWLQSYTSNMVHSDTLSISSVVDQEVQSNFC